MAQSGLPRVLLVFPEQYGQTALILGDAFIDDPGFLAILREVTDPRERARRLAMIFSVLLAMNRRDGQPVFGVLDDGRVVGAAIVEGVAQHSTTGMIIGGLRHLPMLLSAAGPAGLIRLIRFQDELYRNRPREPHIYLNVLGVDPKFQGRHCGIALLDHLHELAAARPDVAGVYLETAKEQNVVYYGRRGYEVIGEMNPIGVRMWKMIQRRGAPG